jgi:hypothetical protein
MAQQHPSVGWKGIALKAPAPLSSTTTTHTGSGKGPAPGHNKRSLPPLSEAPAPAPKRAKRTSEDAVMVAPLPIIAFLKSKRKRKACGKCKECKKPPCGICKACEFNAKGTDKRRCEALRCLKLPEDDVPAMPKAPPGQDPIPSTVEGVTVELNNNAMELSKLAGIRAHDREAKAKYKALLARKAILHSAQISLRNIRSRRKSRFPVGFPEAWGIINRLEKTRARFAEYIVKQSPGNNSAAVERKRSKRDTLDRTISEWCSLWSEELCPADDEDADKFWKLINMPREQIESDESEEDDDEQYASSPSESDFSSGDDD